MADWPGTFPCSPQRCSHYLGVRDGGIYIDGTFGAGGYTRAILDAADCKVIGIDRDPSAIARGADLVASRERAPDAGRGSLFQSRCTWRKARVTTPSTAWCSMSACRRCSSTRPSAASRSVTTVRSTCAWAASGPSAADLIAIATDRDLAAIIARLGEERFARPIARAIVRARSEAPILTTKQLSAIVERVVHARPGQIHPATRTFQALRIFVNEELVELAGALSAAERILKPGGRLVVVSFHSLEDRIVKTFLTERSRDRGRLASRAGSARARSRPSRC